MWIWDATGRNIQRACDGRNIQRDGHARSIILDGRTFSHAYQRAHLVAFVRDQRVPLLFIECVCSDETARRRLAAHAATGVHPARNRDDALYRRVKDLFEPITEPKIVVDTDRALEDYLPTCLTAVRAFMTAEARHTTCASSRCRPAPSDI
jgi:predicted kinase